MAEINIPMRTKASMDLGMMIEQAGEERIQAAMDLQNMQNEMQQRMAQQRTEQQRMAQPGTSQSSFPPRAAQPGTSQSSFPSRAAQPGASQSSFPSRAAQPGVSQSSFPSRTAQPGMLQNGTSSVQNPMGRSGSGSRREVHHYEVQAEGGSVLNKGGKVSFRSLYPGHLGKIEVVMGWDANDFTEEDVDASCFMLGENGKAVGDEWFVFYNQPSSPDGSIVHQGKRSGEKKERIVVDFSRLGQQVKRLAFVLTINEAKERGYSFSQVGNAHVRIRDAASKKELALFNLSDYYEGVTAMTVCEFYEYHGEWKINPVGHGLKDTGLLELCRFYGVMVE